MPGGPLVLHKMVVLVPFRNAGSYIVDCVNSVLEQQYNNYEIFLLDDASDDGTLDRIEGEADHVHKIRNKRRMGPMENVHHHLTRLPIGDDDIVVLLDGDDFLFGEYALQIVNGMYNNDALLTYGQYINSYGQRGHCSEYTREEFEHVRSAAWKASHLKTFKYKLFKACHQQAPDGASFRFKDGEFYTAASDQAIMIPLMEIAGYEKVTFVPNMVYCYRIHPKNDHNSARGLDDQMRVVYDIRNKPPLKQMF